MNIQHLTFNEPGAGGARPPGAGEAAAMGRRSAPVPTTYAHPEKVIVALEVAHGWTADGALYLEKLDGRFDTMTPAPGQVLAGERMADGAFIVWDCLMFEGQDLRPAPARERWRVAVGLAQQFRLPVAATADDGGALLRRVLAAGGEGVVRKVGSYWEPMQAAKRGGVWRCRVRGLVPGSQSVEIVDAETGQDRGRVALRGGKADQVRPGSIIRVEGMNLTAAGKIRQPVPARQWLVSF